MKRAVALVDYGSSDDEETDAHTPPTDSAPTPPAKKLKKLPALSKYLAPEGPVDNPALHQGRRRTTPHVEGQFAAYVYVPLTVERNSKLHKLLLRIFTSAKLSVSSLHPVGFTQPPLDTNPEPVRIADGLEDAKMELHISLTRPTFLRAHQREEFKRIVKVAAKSRHSFSASFAALSELTNDEHTRTFLTLEVGAGHEDLKALSDELSPFLRTLRQKEFYEDPRFHASIAWALLDGAKPPHLEAQVDGSAPTSAPSHQAEKAPSATGDKTGAAHTTPTGGAFPTIPCFPETLIPQLQAEFSRELVRAGVGTFEAEEVHVRIGKEVSRWRLQG